MPHAKYEIPSADPYSDQPWKQSEKVHAAMVTRMDRDIGNIMALLKEKGVDENTIVFFCSDICETRNLAAEHAEIARQFAEYLTAVRTESEHSPVK